MNGLPENGAIGRRPAEGGHLSRRLARQRPHSNATPRLWRALREWALDGRLVGLLLALASATAMAYFFLSPNFLVREIEVRGNQVLPTAEAIAGSRVLGSNLFLLDIGQVEARLRQVRYVEGVRVERFLPNRVRLTIEERFPAVSWCNEATWNERYLVDDSGTLVGLEQPGMAVIYVVDASQDVSVLRIGDRVDAVAVQTAQQVFSRLYNDLNIELLPFRYHKGRGITAVSAAGWQACFGNSEHLEAKVSNLLALLQGGVPFQVVDLRLPDQVRILR